MAVEASPNTHVRELDPSLESGVANLFKKFYFILAFSTPELPEELRRQMRDHSLTGSKISAEFQRGDLFRVWYKNSEPTSSVPGEESISIDIIARDNSNRDSTTLSCQGNDRHSISYLHAGPGTYIEDNNQEAFKKASSILYVLK